MISKRIINLLVVNATFISLLCNKKHFYSILYRTPSKKEKQIEESACASKEST